MALRINALDPQVQEYIKDLRKKAKLINRLSNVAVFSGFAGLPLAFIFVITDNKWPSVAALCWFMGHLVGWIAKSLQQDLAQAQQRYAIAEGIAKSIEEAPEKQDQPTARFHNRISLN